MLTLSPEAGRLLQLLRKSYGNVTRQRAIVDQKPREMVQRVVMCR